MDAWRTGSGSGACSRGQRPALGAAARFGGFGRQLGQLGATAGRAARAAATGGAAGKESPSEASRSATNAVSSLGSACMASACAGSASSRFQFRSEFRGRGPRLSSGIDFVVVPGQQIGRGGDLGPGLGLHFNVEIRGLAGI